MKTIQFLFFKKPESGQQEPYNDFYMENIDIPRQGEQVLLKCPDCENIHYHEVISIARRYNFNEETNQTDEAIFIHLVAMEDLEGHTPSFENFNLN